MFRFFLCICLLISGAWCAEKLEVGLASNGTVIEGFSTGPPHEKRTVLLIGGPNRSERKLPFRLIVIPDPNPGRVLLQFPPAGPAYRNDPEAHYLLRWIEQLAPDLVVIAGSDSASLSRTLASNRAGQMGSVPTLSWDGKRSLAAAVPVRIEQSEASRELERRLARSPVEVSQELEPHYGREFSEAVYVPGMSLIARLRLGHIQEVERLAAPFVNGSKDTLAKATGSHLAGHLVFAELAAITKNPRYVELVRRAADLGFDDNGQMKASMPFHNEMSDAVFMGGPILAKAGKLTGEARYFDMALRHFRFIENLCLRPDGLYRHSPLSDAAWGRGNAFPLLGLALTLQDVPRTHPAFSPMLKAFRKLASTLARHQRHDGMWRQVVDVRGAYGEFSATAMIGRALLAGIRSGWLDVRRFQPRVDAAWNAVSARVSHDGRVTDVCESTGKQKSVADYLNREAIQGYDARGGGMALLFALDRADFLREASKD